MKKIIAGITAVLMAVTGAGISQRSGSVMNVSAVSSAEDETLAGYAESIFEMVNEERAKEGLELLTFNPYMNAVAQKRAEELITEYSHYRPDGTIWNTILDENNIYASGNGENILKMSGYDDVPQEAMNGWMNSTGHRQNILREMFTDIGVGVAYADGYYYCVQNFAKDALKWNVSNSVLTVECFGNMYDFVSGGRPWEAECDNITEIYFGSDVQSIGTWAFCKMSNLKKVTVPEHIKKVSSFAFYECTSLEEITFMNPECEITDSVFTIDSNAVIYGYENSTAQAYAEKYNRTFKTLEKPSYSLGNINGDEYIDAVDATIVLTEYAELSVNNPSTLSEEQSKFADVNADGQVNAVDSSLILSYYAEVSTGGTLSFEEFLKDNV